MIGSRLEINFRVCLAISEKGICEYRNSHEEIAFPLLLGVNVALNFLFPLKIIKNRLTKLAKVNIMTPTVIKMATNIFLGDSLSDELFLTRLKKTPITTTIMYLILPPMTLFKKDI